MVTLKSFLENNKTLHQRTILAYGWSDRHGLYQGRNKTPSFRAGRMSTLSQIGSNSKSLINLVRFKMDKTPQLEAFGEELLNRIEQSIKETGVFMFGIGEFNLCNDPECKKDHSKDRTFSEVDSAYIYSVGHQKRDRPDFLVLTGPAPGEEAMTSREIVAETISTSKLINFLVDQWDGKPVLEDETCRGPSDRVYQVVDHVKRGQAHPMRDYLTSATVYYQGMDFEFLILAPLPHTLTRGPQNLH